MANGTPEPIEYAARVVSKNYKPKKNEVVKHFDDMVSGQSLPSQANEFYAKQTKVCIVNGTHWDAMPRYRNLTCKTPAPTRATELIEVVDLEENYGVGDDVLITQEDTPDDDPRIAPELKNRWVARILEIRATDSDNVHVLVNWYNRPEDLPGDKQREAYHSMNEIVATNDVDVIEPSRQDLPC